MSVPERRGLFITGTGTGVGKTFVTRGLAHALRHDGVSVAAIKPYETGCAPDPEDALALGRACGRPELANAEGLYRARRPVAPWAATLAGEPPPAPIDTLAATVRGLAASSEIALVEGAGGLRVPVDADQDVADLAIALGLPLLLVARDELGVLSHTLCAYEAARARGLHVVGVVLSSSLEAGDPSQAHNTRILQDRLEAPVFHLGPTDDENSAIARALEASGALCLLRDTWDLPKSTE